MSIDAILQSVEELSPGERAELMGRLWERFGPPDEPGELSDELKALLDRRIADSDTNPGAGIPWDVVKAESLKRART